MAEQRKVIVSIADERLAEIPAVVRALEQAGLTVDSVLEPIGAVTGSIGQAGVAALQDVPGVRDVELQRDAGTR
ncbi:hypothetical protein [Amycolatopsis albispora]|uniref:Ketohydroxyglutarate aldolase n=1 Tax=Amycolatopsis albispora TaxID=1804986 RepID=A0A344L4N4_9PSEU|nr:hypothetical protein [Amycolatopsis albispora]AXB43008.1 hypothetical protein A4R43_10985 [Amycolatopsis albispora]